MRCLPPFPSCRTVYFATLLILSLMCACKPKPVRVDPVLVTPSLAIETQRALLGDGPVFATPAAVIALQESAPTLLGDPDADNPADDAAFLAAVSDPSLWRKLDRKYRFTAVLLAGPPTGYQRLARYLTRSADWSLSYLDHAAMIFQRTPKSDWKPSALQPLDERFANHPEHEWLIYNTSLAATLAAAGLTREAEAYLDLAIGKDATNATAHLQLAMIHAGRKQWKKALTETNLALETRPDLIEALAVKAETLLALGRPTEAYPLTQRLVKTHGASAPTILFLHARASHGVHDYNAEITALRQLVDLAEASNMPTSAYRTYLGQAYSASGDPTKALAEFETLLASPDLKPAEREFAEKAAERLRNSKKLF